MQKNAKFALLGAVLISLTSAAGAAESPEQIVAKSWERYRLAKSEQEVLKLEIQYADGRKESKGLTRWLRYDPQGEDRVVIRFSSPPADDGLGLLTWRHAQGADDQWLKLPSLAKSRRIPANDQEKYFAGTDLTYEDTRMLMGERTANFNYALVAGGEPGWRIDATPKADTASGYGKRTITIDPSYAVRRIDYFGRNGQLIKTQTLDQIHTEKSGLWRADRVEIDNRSLQRKTTLVSERREVGNDIPDSQFSQKFLEGAR